MFVWIFKIFNNKYFEVNYVNFKEWRNIIEMRIILV